MIYGVERSLPHISGNLVRKKAESSSPTADRPINSVSEADREKAREFRKNALKSDGLCSHLVPSHLPPSTVSLGLDLSAIARTSAAVSTSPPSKTVTATGGAEVRDCFSFRSISLTSFERLVLRKAHK